MNDPAASGRGMKATGGNQNLLPENGRQMDPIIIHRNTRLRQLIYGLLQKYNLYYEPASWIRGWRLQSPENINFYRFPYENTLQNSQENRT